MLHHQVSVLSFLSSFSVVLIVVEVRRCMQAAPLLEDTLDEVGSGHMCRRAVFAPEGQRCHFCLVAQVRRCKQPASPLEDTFDEVDSGGWARMS